MVKASLVSKEVERKDFLSLTTLLTCGDESMRICAIRVSASRTRGRPASVDPL